MKLPKLNFPDYKFKVEAPSVKGQSSKIFDIIRRKYFSLTPEEWVRQHIVHYLVQEKSVPKSLIAIEKGLKVIQLSRRTDVLVYNTNLAPVMLIECKSPEIKISQTVFDQAARYNLSLAVNYFVLTNGIETICCSMNHEQQQYEFLEAIPDYSLMSEI